MLLSNWWRLLRCNNFKKSEEDKTFKKKFFSSTREPARNVINSKVNLKYISSHTFFEATLAAHGTMRAIMKPQKTVGLGEGKGVGLCSAQRQQVRVLLGDKVRLGARKQKAVPVVLAPVRRSPSSSSSLEPWTRFTRTSSPQHVGSHGRQRCPPPSGWLSTHWHWVELRGLWVMRAGGGQLEWWRKVHIVKISSSIFLHLISSLKVFELLKNTPKQNQKDFLFVWLSEIWTSCGGMCEQIGDEPGFVFSLDSGMHSFLKCEVEKQKCESFNFSKTKRWLRLFLFCKKRFVLFSYNNITIYRFGGCHKLCSWESLCLNSGYSFCFVIYFYTVLFLFF